MRYDITYFVECEDTLYDHLLSNLSKYIYIYIQHITKYSEPPIARVNVKCVCKFCHPPNFQIQLSPNIGINTHRHHAQTSSLYAY